MKNFWKKLGWLALTCLPVLISLIAQIGMGVILVFIITFANISEISALTADPVALSEFIMGEYPKYSGAGIFSYQLIALAGFGIWYYLSCGRCKPTKPLKVFHARSFSAVVFVSLGLCLFANSLVLVGQFIAPAVIENYTKLMEAAGMGVDFFTILASILIAPIGEELLCRGLTYHYAKKVAAGISNRTAAFWLANILQALMFGIMHGNLVQGLYAFILGLGLGWLRERYHSLYPAMLAHFIINFSSIYLVGYPISLLPETLPSYLLLMLFALALSAVGFYLAGAIKTQTEAAVPSQPSKQP